MGLINTAPADSIFLRCDCQEEILVIDKYIDNDEVFYNISIKNSNYENINGIKNRIRNAFKVLFGKPVYYNDIFVEDKRKMINFFYDLERLIKRNY